MPTAMFVMFVATLIAGSMGAGHYVVVHIIMGKPFDGEIRSSTDELSDGGVK